MSFLLTNFEPPPTTVRLANRVQQRFGPDATGTLQRGRWLFLQNELRFSRRAARHPFSVGDATALCTGELHNADGIAADLAEQRIDLEPALWPHNSSSRARRRVLDLLSHCELLALACLAWGADCAPRLRGEYAAAVVDFGRAQVVLTSDVFATHPLWHAVWRHEGSVRIAVSSLESALIHLGAPSGARVEAPPNTAVALSFEGDTIRRLALKPSWDLRQFKKDTRDWETAFERAVRRRTQSLLEPPDAMPLSSGFDSGALLLALHRSGHRLRCYFVPAGDSEAVVERRATFCRRGLRVVSSPAALRGVEEERAIWREIGEHYVTHWSGGSTKAGTAVGEQTNGLVHSALERLSRFEGARQRVFLSALGPDNSYATCLGGASGPVAAFPADLLRIFPWQDFYSWRKSGTRDYLVAGMHGMEARYPFLDVDLVQEYLWLHETVKNAEYKAPIGRYFATHGLPYRRNFKVFNHAPGEKCVSSPCRARQKLAELMANGTCVR